VYRLFVFDFLGESTLVLPAQLAAASGKAGFFSILLGGLLGGLYLWYLSRVLRGMGTDLVSFVQEKFPCWLGRILFGFLLVTFVGLAGYGAYLFADVMRYSLLPGESYTLILLVILVLAAYAVYAGIESRARVCEVLFVMLFVLLFLMLLVAAGTIDPQHFADWQELSAGAVARGSLPAALCFIPLFLVLFFPAYVTKNSWGKMLRAVFGALWSAILVILALYAVLVGNFGTGALSTMRYPAVILMSSIPLRGSFLKRLDTFLIGIWFFTLFALVSVFLFYGQELLQNMWKKKKIVRSGTRWILAILLLLVFVAAEWFYYGNLLDYFESYLCFLGVPLLVVLPAVLLVI
jgi:spore germination protein KB